MAKTNSRRKSAATRAANANEKVLLLCEAIQENPGQSVWGLTYGLNGQTRHKFTAAFINKALADDARCIALVQDYLVAIPSRTLRYPAWVKHVDDVNRLPTIAPEEKLSTALMPLPETGNATLDGNYAAMNRTVIDMARKLPAHIARSCVDEMGTLIGATMEAHREMVDENQMLKVSPSTPRPQVRRVPPSKFPNQQSAH